MPEEQKPTQSAATPSPVVQPVVAQTTATPATTTQVQATPAAQAIPAVLAALNAVQTPAPLVTSPVVPVDSGPQAPQSDRTENKQNESDLALTQINRDLEEKATQARAKEMNVPYIDVGAFPINPDILHLVPMEAAQKSMAMLFYKNGKTLKLAIADPSLPDLTQLVRDLEAKEYKIQLNLASHASVIQAQRLYASDQYKLKVEVKNVIKEDEVRYEKELENLTVIRDQLATLPAEESLNLLNVSAIKAGASDIHYEPEETTCTLRFRIDGVLHKVFEVTPEIYARLSNQLKYKAGMKLNITTIPQDGRYRFIVNDRKIDVRVSALPTEYGESIVCRILDSGKKFGKLEDLGFSARSLQILQRASGLAQGMVLVTGPTGSGKTTTLYVVLQSCNQPDVKVITLEDPIEYHLKGITQSQVNEKRGYTFSDGLRSILRQDPDVVMIGEIRDIQTAEVAMQAALTGHVVLSTIHTNSAVETIPRLITIGVPPFMVAPAISIIVAQRLVRRLCEKCHIERSLTPEEVVQYNSMLEKIRAVDPEVPATLPKSFMSPKGCENCNGTGYHGQMTISEVLAMDDVLRQAVLDNKSAGELSVIARKQGMITMQEDGFLKVLAGNTTLDEVHRVTNA